jgi:hypothetical protein
MSKAQGVQCILLMYESPEHLPVFDAHTFLIVEQSRTANFNFTLSTSKPKERSRSRNCDIFPSQSRSRKCIKIMQIRNAI